MWIRVNWSLCVCVSVCDVSFVCSEQKNCMTILIELIYSRETLLYLFEIVSEAKLTAKDVIKGTSS